MLSINNIKVLNFYPFSDLPSIAASIIVNNNNLNIIITHPTPPISESFVEQQTIHMENLAEFINSNNQLSPVNDKPLLIVAGDLNNTPWSPSFKQFMQSTSLHSSRQGRGLYPTWPSTNTMSDLLQIPLDYVLVSENIYTENFETLESIDSDHLPVYTEHRF